MYLKMAAKIVHKFTESSFMENHGSMQEKIEQYKQMCMLIKWKEVNIPEEGPSS